MSQPPRSHLSALILALFVAFPMSAAAIARDTQPAGVSARPAVAVARFSLDQPWDDRARPKQPAPGGDPLVSAIVKLDVAPLAAYTGGLPGLAPTAPRITGAPQLDAAAADSQRYLRYLDQRQRDFETQARAAIPQAQVIARYRHVFGGAAVVLPESQLARLAKLPGVVSVQRDQLRHVDTDRSPQFIGANVIWRALAASPTLGDGGQGVIVGVIDTGIWPEHPSFADDGSYPPPQDWHGTACQFGSATPGDVPFTCNNKLIGARQSMETYKALFGPDPGGFDSARDNEGHGTHTASTAAGNANVAATLFGQPRGTVSGIAPRAHVAAYKVCGNEGCFDSDSVTAIEQAVADGVDVINFSVGSIVASDPYQEADALAFLDAYRAGIFVAVSAGNAGPDAATIGSPANAPWVMSVGASTTDRQFINQLTLRSGADTLSVSGASITAGVSGARVVDAASLGDAMCESALPNTVAGAIVLCMRGSNARVEKSANVKAGGGAGMVLYNAGENDVETDNHWVPTIHINTSVGERVLAFTNAHSTTAILGDITLSQRTTKRRFGDIMADFSSRGPLPNSQLGISKPDVTAPGVQILAGHTPSPNLAVEGPPGELFQAIAGTSMASPHVAGAGALLKALHPDWTPGQIKSALMTTAWTNVVKQDGVTPADPYDMGSGRIDLSRAGDPGLTLDVSADHYAGGQGHLQDLNYPSISMPSMPGRLSTVRVVHSELDQDATWSTSVKAPAGVRVTINPSQIRVPARGDASFVVTVDAGGLPDDTYFATLLLRSGKRQLHIPISFVRTQPPIALEQRCDPTTIERDRRTMCTITATNNGLDAATISIRDKIPSGLSIRRSSIVGASYDSSTRTLSFVGQLPGMIPAALNIVSDTAGLPTDYLALASLGVPPSPCTPSCDDVAITYIAPAFTFDGVSYDRVTITTNGYLIIGDDTTLAIFNQRLPNPFVPNNVVAPYWTDLDLLGSAPDDPGGGAWYAAYVTFQGDPRTWFVAEWADAARYSRSAAESHHSFQVWIEGGSDQIHMVYGPNSPIEDRVTVGAENADGTVGGNYYVNTTPATPGDEEGTPPLEGDVLGIFGTPEQHSTATITYQLRGGKVGKYNNTAELTSSTFAGTNIVVTPLEVVRR
jgi:subtilisin family serine protease